MEASVQCKTCEEWVHFSCAEVTSAIADFDYACEICDPNGDVRALYNIFMSKQSKEGLEVVELDSLLTKQNELIIQCKTQFQEYKKLADPLVERLLSIHNTIHTLNTRGAHI